MKRARFLILAAVLSGGVDAAAANGAETNHVRAELVGETTSIQPGQPFWVAVRLEMDQGWHVNWINPGDAGLAPRIEWALPEGFAAGDIRWPYPERFAVPELSMFGYEGSVSLMVEIRPPSALGHERVELRARVTWLACRDVCIPGEAQVVLALPVDARTPQDDAGLAGEFEATRRRIPAVSSAWRFSARVTDERIIISAIPRGTHATPVEAMVFYPVDQGIIENAVEQKLEKTVKGYDLAIARARIGIDKLARIRGVLVSPEGWGPVSRNALEIDVPVE
ncbi:MAG: protein-disulfide reductase DsbD domain-containing protein [Candidatus Krumholzibacteriia bacterium]